MKILSVFLLSIFVLSAKAYSATFKVDPAASTVAWKADKKIMKGHIGKVQLREGQIETNAKNEIVAMTVTADMATISNDDLADDPDSQKKLVRHLSSDDFFNVEKFPTATFTLKSLEKKGAETIAKGDLTFIGKTNAVEFPVTTSVDKASATIAGKLAIERTKWGLVYGSGNFFKELTANKIIKDTFELDVKIVAKK